MKNSPIQIFRVISYTLLPIGTIVSAIVVLGGGSNFLFSIAESILFFVFPLFIILCVHPTKEATTKINMVPDQSAIAPEIKSQFVFPPTRRDIILVVILITVGIVILFSFAIFLV